MDGNMMSKYPIYGQNAGFKKISGSKKLRKER